MAHVQLGSILGYLRRMVRPPTDDGEADRHLLERFAFHHDEVAFAELVQRHGPMVLNVCERVLADTHAAEDAFQAVFLVLARRAGAVRWQESIASWLHQVAYRVAVKARAATWRRLMHERQAGSMSRADRATDDACWLELRTVLDEELTHLPAKYRAPLVLCYLEGKTNEQAAQLLGWTKGTVSGRLARARDLLRDRLTRRGLTLSAGTLAVLLVEKTAAASLRPMLLATTVQAAPLFGAGSAVPGMVSAEAAALAEGVMHAMLLSKVRCATLVGLLVWFAAVGLVLMTHGLLARSEAPPAHTSRPHADDLHNFAAEPDDEKPKDAAPALPKIEPLDYINRVHVQFSAQQRFGIVCPRLRDPRNPQSPKRLTRDERGITNNTCVRIEGYEYIYGVEIPGVRYVKENGKLLKEVPIPGKDKDRSWMSVWESDFARIRVTQSVEIIVGEQTRLYDTVVVRYHIWNRDKNPHTIGLRVMLDTFTGSADGLPFYYPPSDQEVADEMARAKQPPAPPEKIAALIADLDSDQFDVRQKAQAELERVLEAATPALVKVLQGNPSLELRLRVEALLAKRDGRTGLVDTMKTFQRMIHRNVEVPSFLRSVEHLGSDGAVAQLGLRVKGTEPLEKMVICRWPQNSEARWGGTNAPGDWAYEPMDKNPNAKDSAIVLYWQQANMKPNEQRELAFTYGLGRVLADNLDSPDSAVAQRGDQQMRLFVDPRATSDRPFVVTAYLQNGADKTVTLQLPEGLMLTDGQPAAKVVPVGTRDGYSQVTWKVKPIRSGTFKLQADLAGIGVAREVVSVHASSLLE